MNIKINNDTKQEAINWNKPQILEQKSGFIGGDCVVIMYNGTHQNNTFTGIRLNDGHYSSSYLKQDFKPFNGTITLLND